MDKGNYNPVDHIPLKIYNYVLNLGHNSNKNSVIAIITLNTEKCLRLIHHCNFFLKNLQDKYVIKNKRDAIILNDKFNDHNVKINTYKNINNSIRGFGCDILIIDPDFIPILDLNLFFKNIIPVINQHI